nr:aspartate kinase [Nocardiopsis lucentensis]
MTRSGLGPEPVAPARRRSRGTPRRLTTPVWKFGGSSLATTERVRAAARRAGAAYRSGGPLAVVVSAQGDTTDALLSRAADVGSTAAGRELDQLLATGENASAALMAIALQGLGVPAVAVTGSQSGILATGRHGTGVVVAVDPERILRVLDGGKVAVVAGFQGTNEEGDVITLGRGGSDSSAAALAAGLGAHDCDILTDVAGVYTADPRICPSAQLMPVVPNDVMAEMAFAGARVMHTRAVEIAALHDVELRVRSSFEQTPGTRIPLRGDGGMVETVPAAWAVVHDLDVARVELSAGGAGGATVADLYRRLARRGITVDMVGSARDGRGGLTSGMTVRRSDVPEVRRALERVAGPSRGRVVVDEEVARVSVVGTGLLSRPEYTARMLSCLRTAGIEASALSTSQARICVTVPSASATLAVRRLHQEFGLDGARNDQ